MYAFMTCETYIIITKREMQYLFFGLHFPLLILHLCNVSSNILRICRIYRFFADRDYDIASLAKFRLYAYAVSELVAHALAQIKANPACLLIYTAVVAGIAFFKHSRKIIALYSDAAVAYNDLFSLIRITGKNLDTALFGVFKRI